MKKGIVASVVSAIAGAGVGAAVVGKSLDKKVNNWKKMSDKHLSLFLMMNQWIKVKQEGKNLEKYFLDNNYHTVAVYGMSYAGETLVDELKGSNIKVLYGIDKKADNIYSDIEIVSPEDNLQAVDVIVVTSITFFDEIEKVLEKKVDCPIISLEDILYEI